MTSGEMKELDAAGFWWDQQEAEGGGTWEARYGYYEHFKNVHGREPKVEEVMRTDKGDFDVGKWLRGQRREFRRGRMESGRIRRMEEAGVKWDGRWRGG